MPAHGRGISAEERLAVIEDELAFAHAHAAHARVQALRALGAQLVGGEVPVVVVVASGAEGGKAGDAPVG